MGLIVENAGPSMSVQDLGRKGYAYMGITESGALDKLCVRVINGILGNDENDAVIEMILMGGTFRFTEKTTFVLGGAQMNATLERRSCELYKVYRANEGDVLTVGFAKTGCHGYLAVAGGIKVPEIMGSKSTNIKCKFGGFGGRTLEVGDVVSSSLNLIEDEYSDRDCSELIEKYYHDDEIRVLKGLQYDSFTEEGLHNFFSQEYEITPLYDRMGCRLKGIPVSSVNGYDIVSDSINTGSIQISADGQPIVMLADHQTIGGYTKIATVISADISRFVQHKPGESVRFRLVSIGEAMKAMKKQEKMIRRICRR